MAGARAGKTTLALGLAAVTVSFPAGISVAGYARRHAEVAGRGNEACLGAMVLNLDHGLGVQAGPGAAAGAGPGR